MDDFAISMRDLMEVGPSGMIAGTVKKLFGDDGPAALVMFFSGKTFRWCPKFSKKLCTLHKLILFDLLALVPN